MEIIISPKLDKIPKEKRIKTPFFYAINNLKKDYKFFRIQTKTVTNILGTRTNVHLSKLDDSIRKNNNLYSLDTIIKDTRKKDSKAGKLNNRTRSLDFYYFYFLGYYELNNTQENYIKFLEEYLYFYFEYVKQFLSFFKSKRFTKLFTYEKNNYLKYNKNGLYLKYNSICIPSLLKCPDIGKFVVSYSNYYLGGNINEFYPEIIQNFLKFNTEKIKECFNNQNLDNFFEIINLNNYNITTGNKIINFANSFGNSKIILTDNRNYLESEDGEEYYDEDTDEYYSVNNEYNEECLDIYYLLFNEKYTLKELFEIAFKNLIKSGYSF